MNKQDFVKLILDKHPSAPAEEIVSAYMPSNIALCKYWGKRDEELNLPVTSSLSVSLADRGATTLLKVIDAEHDEIIVGERSLPKDSMFGKRLVSFLDLFRLPGMSFHVETNSNIPIAAGLASSAAGFSAIVSALDLLFNWQLSNKELSLLARLGSGSACRSFWNGFVEWHRGEQVDGLDSFAEPIEGEWPELRVGLLIIHHGEKSISSREAMRISKATSHFYKLWPEQVNTDLVELKKSIAEKDFELLGSVSERNALAMHSLMLTSQPTISYWQPETLAAMQQIWQLRQSGVPVYFTQDAGPNLKLLFLAEDAQTIQQAFPTIEMVSPFITNG